MIDAETGYVEPPNAEHIAQSFRILLDRSELTVLAELSDRIWPRKKSWDPSDREATVVKIAYFSPMPPTRTGIATYSSYLIPALSDQMEIDLFEHGDLSRPGLNYKQFDYTADPSCLLTLGSYDACIYHIGNQPDYHREIYRVLLRQPGIVVLHDTVLYSLVAGAGPGALLKELCLDRGYWALRDWGQILAEAPGGDILRYPHPERFPLLMRVLRQSSAIIVHSETTKRLLSRAGYRRPIQVVHVPASQSFASGVQGTDDVETRAELGIPSNTLLIGAFGLIRTTKRLEQLLHALDSLDLNVSFRLLLVGASDDHPATIETSRITQFIIRRGFVSDADFVRYLAAADIVVNLRYSTRGEASLTLIQAMACGRTCIVSNHAWFSELPDDCVCKTAYGRSEVQDLGQAIVRLAADADLRKTIGAAAHGYVLSHCLPASVASEYKAFLEKCCSPPGNQNFN